MGQPSKRFQTGFTLTETLVVLFLISFGVVLLSTIFFAFNRAYQRESARVDLYVETTVAMNVISEYLQTAREVLASQTVNGTLYTSDTDSIALSLQSIASDGMINSASVDYVGFQLTGPRLMMELDANDVGRNNQSRAIARFIAGAQFAYDAETPGAVKAVTVHLQARRTIGTQAVEVNIQRTIRLRN